MRSLWLIWFVACAALCLLRQCADGFDPAKQVVYAVNCGGDAHTDVFGVKYAKDTNKAGTASDYGKQLQIARVPQQDQTLYQTERYHTSTFGYDISVQEDGWYLLVLKFCEVYFNSPNMKVFDVVLNGDLNIASELDIFDSVGRGVAHDEYIEFQVQNGKILYEGDESEITGGKLRIEFIKSYRDNPKVNAIVLIKGRLKDWTPLPPLMVDQDDDEDDLSDPDSLSDAAKVRNPSGPKAKNPYELEDSSQLLPVFVAIGAFIPLVFCLCKL